MENIKSNASYDFTYYTCIYSGISNKLDFEIKHGEEDKRERLKYIVDRYCNEVVISGAYLQEKYNEYVEALKDKGIISE